MIRILGPLTSRLDQTESFTPFLPFAKLAKKEVKMGGIILGSEYFQFPNVIPYVRADDVDTPRVVAVLKAAQPGDLLLIKTPGFGFELGRRLTRNLYDHIAVVLDDEKTMNIVNPRAVILPIMAFAKPERKPIILRPKWKNPEQREMFVEEMKVFDRGPYNLKKTLIGITTSVLYVWLGLRIPIKKLEGPAPRWICTEAILTSIMRAYPDFQRINSIKLDYHSLGFATTNDFFRICKSCPDLLEVVILS